jgi:hypothetical protein
MNRTKSFGIQLDNESRFDDWCRRVIAEYIETRAKELHRSKKTVTISGLACVLEIDRERLSRICKKLEITHIFY